MGKLLDMLNIVKSANYIIITDTSNIGRVSPLYVDEFIIEIDRSREELKLLSIKHDRMLQRISDNEHFKL